MQKGSEQGIRQEPLTESFHSLRQRALTWYVHTFHTAAWVSSLLIFLHRDMIRFSLKHRKINVPISVTHALVSHLMRSINIECNHCNLLPG